jgi:cadmium resistance protein CadD (predicted permease)
MKLHRFDALSFIFGVLIAATGLVFLVLPEPGDIVDVLTDFGSWFWPTVFIAIGLGILAPLLSRNDDSEETETD